MNILIKEFAEQARTHFPKTESSGEYWVFDEQKFAELIVKECNRYACSAWEHGPLLGRDLLIHFGVVEMSDE
jgi:hypothetical protein